MDYSTYTILGEKHIMKTGTQIIFKFKHDFKLIASKFTEFSLDFNWKNSFYVFLFKIVLIKFSREKFIVFYYQYLNILLWIWTKL